MDDVCLVYVIENSFTNINCKTHSGRLLETEAIKSIKSWRSNAGELSEIPIYVICVTNNTPSRDCIKKIHELNATYIHNYLPQSEQFDNGWWNKPLGCAYLESQITHDYIIHLDLDMYLINNLTVDYKHNTCLVYDVYDSLSERNNVMQTNIFNTCYMTCVRKDKIFTQWLEILTSSEIEDLINQYFTNISRDKYEEAALDILNIQHDNKLIKPIKDIMYGETYTSLGNMSSIDKICFHHYHVYSSIDLDRYDFSESRRQLQALRAGI